VKTCGSDEFEVGKLIEDRGWEGCSFAHGGDDGDCRSGRRGDGKEGGRKGGKVSSELNGTRRLRSSDASSARLDSPTLYKMPPRLHCDARFICRTASRPSGSSEMNGKLTGLKSLNELLLV